MKSLRTYLSKEIPQGIYSRDKINNSTILQNSGSVACAVCRLDLVTSPPEECARIERVQRRATQLIRELKDLSFEQRLHTLSSFSLEKRCLRGEMIAIYTFLNGDSSIGKKLFSLRLLKGTCGHSMKVEEKWFNLKLHKGFFTVRIKRMWNSLPQSVSVKSVDNFKNLYQVLDVCSLGWTNGRSSSIEKWIFFIFFFV